MVDYKIWVCVNCGSFWKQDWDIPPMRDEKRNVFCSDPCRETNGHTQVDVKVDPAYV